VNEAARIQTLEGVPQEGERLARAAREASVPLVLLGGVAVWVRCPSARSVPLGRAYGDADFVGRSRDRVAITALMRDHGYEPDRMFNALHGASRLNFHDPARDRPVDVLLDRFTMCHELDLRDRLGDERLTIPLADLLLTKLQVVSLNEKDVRDILALLLDHDIAPEAIDLARILDVTRADWGFEHTIHRTLATVRARVGEAGLAQAAVDTIVGRADELRTALDAAPKAAKWKMRARVGERVRWYQEPEEARA
jgi:hypothetical protein